MKFSLTIFIAFYSLAIFGQQNQFNSEKEMASFALGQSFYLKLIEFYESQSTVEKPDVSEFISGIQSALDISNNKSISYTQGLRAGLEFENYLNWLGTPDMIDYNRVYTAILQADKNEKLLMHGDSVNLIIQKYLNKYYTVYKNNKIENEKDKKELISAENLKASIAFMKANKNQPGVVTTSSGLQYKIEQNGVGDSPTANDKIKIKYVGKFIDGTIYDSATDRPFSHTVSQLIPGLTEGLQLMNKGAKFTFFIAPDLAYGDTELPFVGPNQALIYEVELLDFAPIDGKLE